MPLLTLAHSPDPDDVFMWWPLGTADTEPVFDTGGLRFDRIAEDIQVLNRRAIDRGDLDITAVSINTYPLIARRYMLTDCAGSWGEGYGPKVIVRGSSDAPRDIGGALEWLREPGRRIAVPGVNTTAFLTFSLMLAAKFEHSAHPFHEIPALVAEGKADAGLLIHDAQLTYASLGLREVADLGAWWGAMTNMPLPLGGNVVRRDLDHRHGAGTLARVGGLLRRSIVHAVEHWEEGVARIAPMTLGLDRATVDKYLRMYVNARTIDAGDAGRSAVAELFRRGVEGGLCADPGPVDWLRCGDTGRAD
jgi:1,4-dihydroxy-6-naphthoate synthase